MTSLFERQFLAFLVVVLHNKWHFWNPETKLDKIGMFSNKIFSLKNWPFWPDLDLNLGQIWKWVSPLNYTSQIIHKNVSHETLAIFTCGDLIWLDLWPWPVLRISILLTRHLLHAFNSILAGFGLAPVSGLVSAADKGDTSQLWPLTWPWPEIWPC